MILSASIGYAQKKPIAIQDQGSFAVGWTVITNPGTFDPIKRTPEGQTFHGDHAYVFYQIPVLQLFFLILKIRSALPYAIFSRSASEIEADSMKATADVVG